MNLNAITQILEEAKQDNAANDPIMLMRDVAKEKEKDFNIERFKTGIIPMDRVLKLRKEDQGGLTGGDIVIISAPTGNGKCFAKGTGILMFNGSTKKVEDIIVGDVIMGDDSKKRVVKSLGSGKEEMFSITPTKGDSYTVNKSHILSLVRTNDVKNNKYNNEKLDISVEEYLTTSKNFKHLHKGYRVGVSFQKKHLLIDPYILGVWLGDGCSKSARIESADSEIVASLTQYAVENGWVVTFTPQAKSKSGAYSIVKKQRGSGDCFQKRLRSIDVLGNKHIPLKYKTGSKKQRLELLAGLIDSDGYWNNPCGLIFVNKNEILVDDFIYLCRSLGLAAYKKKFTNKKYQKDYFRVTVSGDVFEIPLKLERKKCYKRRQKKDVLRVGIKVKSVGVGNYYGFELEGNKKRLLLADFTVAHNTTLASNIALNMLQSSGIPCAFFTYEVNVYNLWQSFKEMGIEEKSDILCVPFEHTTGKLEWVENKIKEAKEKFFVKVVVIDHLGFLAPLQKINSNMSQNYSSYLAQIVRELKTIAVQENIVIILPVHMVKSAGDDPTLRDIGHSGGIAQEADVVILMAREENKDQSNNNYYTNFTKCILAKNRIGGETPSWWMQKINGKLVETIKTIDNTNQNNRKIIN